MFQSIKKESFGFRAMENIELKKNRSTAEVAWSKESTAMAEVEDDTPRTDALSRPTKCRVSQNSLFLNLFVSESYFLVEYRLIVHQLFAQSD